jgi:hypothetical protein
MSTNVRTLRTAVALAALLCLVVALPGCGSGYGGLDYAGTLAVENDPFSFFVIEAFDVQAGLGPVEHYDVDLFPGEGFGLDLYPDDYDVELFWSDGSSDFFSVTVFDGLTTTITGIN